MEQIVVKTEMQPNGEILLFYVDENDPNSSIEQQLMQMHESLPDVNYEVQLEEVPENGEWSQPKPSGKIKWSEEEVQRILVFYIDNKETFITGTAKKKDLWSVACKTMLMGKNAEACEVKLRNLKHKYSALLLEQQSGNNVSWPLFNLCHQAFHDDTYVQYLLREHLSHQKNVKVPIESNPIEDANSSVIVVKNVNSNKSSGDANVQTMLNLYLRYKRNFKKEYWCKGLWETIAIEIGVESAEYWHKKFLNFKQHYLRMRDKRESDGPDSIHWPYMNLFDQIFEDDPDFQRKFMGLENDTKQFEVLPADPNEWNETEKTILVKYYFDCYEEFRDPTIPNNFLWNEIGRLLDKKPEACKSKYEELRKAHLDLYLNGGYSLRERKPLAILFDNIIAKDTEIELDTKKNTSDSWTIEETDELVQFLYENNIVFKDPVCFYVVWPCLSQKLNKSMLSCKKQWEELKNLYKSILDDKKENPDVMLEWRYMELFDRIFDYGMDTTLLNDFKQLKEQNQYTRSSEKIGVKKVQIKTVTDQNDISDEEEFDERGFTKRTKRGVGDSKAFKILEYFHKNKERFSTTPRKKQALWDHLAQQIGISGEQCAHRFRNLKQVYISYVQREINKPEMPILWPYYALCKKVFGYRAIKSKLKNNKAAAEETEEWAPKEIKQIIHYFAANFNEISERGDSGRWAQLASDMNKSETAINNKFLELQKSYRRLKTMKENHPECKVSWKYYNLFDDVYSRLGIEQVEEMDVDHLIDEDDIGTEEVVESQDEDDYQCIIVLPEGQEFPDIGNAQPTSDQEIESTYEETSAVSEHPKRTVTKWNKRSKKKLLILYLNYIRSRRGKEINPKEMWTEIASKLPEKTPFSCKKMLAILKANHLKQSDDEEANRKKLLYHTLVEKIILLKPRFTKKSNSNSKEHKSYKDVILPTAKVELALQYYLQHIEEFASPKFEKKYLWTELANFVSEPINKLFNKINYLKQHFNPETEEVAGEKTLFSELLKEIINKETVLKESNQSQLISSEEDEEVMWSDEEIEQLLVWYLANLDKFKNPKFVRKYLWIEASSILGKSPLACSKKMIEMRTQYKKMIKESPEELDNWKFYGLCQKIYGTGKKNEPTQLAEASATAME